ncbi:MAG: type II toxin-antitoxin system VapC family toxin [Candidatus Acidiferrum sp.]
MVIDTSALLAIFLAEPERQNFLERIRQDGSRLLSAPNALETSIVLEARRGEVAGREFDLFLHRLNIEIVPVDAAQVEVARAGWRRYGKGRHPAGLNFGDCFAYALSKTSGEPLLAKGNDFPKTDVQCL